MSVASPAASRLLYRSLAANSAQTSSRVVRAAAARPCSSQQQQPQQQRKLHTTAPLRGKRSQYASISAEQMGLLDADKPKVDSEMLDSPDYDDTDIEALKKRYTPKQLEALMLGEQAISVDDMISQGKLRKDPARFTYLDDFSQVQPSIDKRVKSGKPVDTSSRFMTPEEFRRDFFNWLRGDRKEAELVDIPQAYELYKKLRDTTTFRDGAEGRKMTVKELNAAIETFFPKKGDERAKVKIIWRRDDGGKEERLIDTREHGFLQQKLKKDIMDQLKEDGASAEELDDLDVRKMSDLELRFKFGLTAEDVSILRTNAREAMEEVLHYLNHRSIMTGFDGGDTALAPDLPPKVPGVAGKFSSEADPDDLALDPEGTFDELKLKTGLPLDLLVELIRKHSKVLVRRYVSNQTRLGKIRSIYCLAVAGVGDGNLGIGQAKSVDGPTATNKALASAIKNMVPIRRYEDRTIYGNVEGKVGGTVVQLFARPPGFGLRIPARLFEMARAAGIRDLAAKMPRARNPMNSVKACFKALTSQPDPERIAVGRGRKLVDARKVYYGGRVL